MLLVRQNESESCKLMARCKCRSGKPNSRQPGIFSDSPNGRTPQQLEVKTEPHDIMACTTTMHLLLAYISSCLTPLGPAESQQTNMLQVCRVQATNGGIYQQFLLPLLSNLSLVCTALPCLSLLFCLGLPPCYSCSPETCLASHNLCKHVWACE